MRREYWHININHYTGCNVLIELRALLHSSTCSQTDTRTISYASIIIKSNGMYLIKFQTFSIHNSNSISEYNNPKQLVFSRFMVVA